MSDFPSFGRQEISDAVTEAVAIKRFRTKLKTEKIIIETSGGDLTIELRELDGERRDAWANDINKRMRPVGDNSGNRVIADHRDFHAYLISLSAFDDGGKPIPITAIRKWPFSVQVEVHQLCQKISGLTEDEQEKNV